MKQIHQLKHVYYYKVNQLYHKKYCINKSFLFISHLFIVCLSNKVAKSGLDLNFKSVMLKGFKKLFLRFLFKMYFSEV